MNNILLITGNTGAGKDTLAQNLKKCPQLRFQPHLYSFGDALKQFTADFYNAQIDNFYTRKNETAQWITELTQDDENPIHTYRQLLQRTSDKIKKYNQRFFTDITLSSVEDVPFIIFPDWRFPYELDGLREKFPNAKIRTIRLGPPVEHKPGQHNSDTSLDSNICDFLLDNSRLSPEQTCEITLKTLKNWFVDLFN